MVTAPQDEPKERPRVILIDGHSLVYRAFFALPSLTDRDGLYGAVRFAKAGGAATPPFAALCGAELTLESAKELSGALARAIAQAEIEESARLRKG